MSLSITAIMQQKNNTNNSSKRNQFQKISCVLLVCIYDTIVFEINNDLVYTRFQQFGNIVRILIFQRKEVTKLFIQYDNCEQAAKAKQLLDGKKLCNNICKMSIYFSTFENVNLRHQTSQGLDLIINNKYLHQDNHSYDQCTDKSPTKNYSDLDQFNIFNKNSGYRFPQSSQHIMQLPRSKTDINQMQWHINQINKQKSSWGGLLYIDQTIKSDIDSILNCQQIPQKWSSQTNSSPIKIINPKLKIQQYKDQSLTVIGFKYNNLIKHIHLYNLFSNFGNISMINIQKYQAKIKFRTIQFAAIAKNYLNNTYLFDNKLELQSYSSYSCQPQQGQYCQIICYDESTDRFTQKKSITINTPSKILHISGMNRQKCTVYEINNMFKHIIAPTKIKILKQHNDKNMALVQFNCIEDSFEIVAECHNMIFGGRKIQISFTKSQI